MFQYQSKYSADDSDVGYDPHKKVGELRSGDIVTFFSHPYAAHDLRGLTSSRVDFIKSFTYDDGDIGATIGVASLDALNYLHNIVDV